MLADGGALRTAIQCGSSAAVGLRRWQRAVKAAGDCQQRVWSRGPPSAAAVRLYQSGVASRIAHLAVCAGAVARLGYELAQLIQVALVLLAAAVVEVVLVM